MSKNLVSHLNTVRMTKSWCLLTRMSVRNVPSSPCVSFQVFSLGSYLGGAGKQECRCDTWIFLFHQQPPLKMLLLFVEIKSWKLSILVEATNRFDFPCVRISHGSSVSQWVVIKDKWPPRGSPLQSQVNGVRHVCFHRSCNTGRSTSLSAHIYN